jgi:GNAT superfamily N-acetyltransferase
VSGEIEIRAATIDDVDAIVRINQRSASEGFGEAAPEFPIVDTRELRSRVAASLARAEAEELVAERDGRVVGLIVVGLSRDPDAPTNGGEVRALYVDPPAWRTGVGSALLAAGLEVLRDSGYVAAALWSFAENSRANDFYEDQGFERDGAEQRRDEFGGVLEVRYRRTI